MKGTAAVILGPGIWWYQRIRPQSGWTGGCIVSWSTMSDTSLDFPDSTAIWVVCCTSTTSPRRAQCPWPLWSVRIPSPISSLQRVSRKGWAKPKSPVAWTSKPLNWLNARPTICWFRPTQRLLWKQRSFLTPRLKKGLLGSIQAIEPRACAWGSLRGLRR